MSRLALRILQHSFELWKNEKDEWHIGATIGQDREKEWLKKRL